MRGRSPASILRTFLRTTPELRCCEPVRLSHLSALSELKSGKLVSSRWDPYPQSVAGPVSWVVFLWNIRKTNSITLHTQSLHPFCLQVSQNRDRRAPTFVLSNGWSTPTCWGISGECRRGGRVNVGVFCDWPTRTVKISVFSLLNQERAVQQELGEGCKVLDAG